VPKDAQRAVLRDAFHAQQLAEADQSRELHDMTGSAGDHSPNYISLSYPYLWTGRSEGDVVCDFGTSKKNDVTIKKFVISAD
jgi:hypothetical protein